MLKLLFAKQLEEYEYNNNNSSSSRIIGKKYMKTDDQPTTNHLPINEHDDWGFFVDFEKIPTTNTNTNTNNHYEKHLNSHTITVAPHEITHLYNIDEYNNKFNNEYNNNFNNNYNKKQDDYSIKHHASLFTCLSVATIFIMYYF